ncbi:MAG: hypothetical protein ACKPEA_12400 [Planctomycetota bacterium]
MRSLPPIAALAAAAIAHAQEASFTPAATMPGPGAWVSHVMTAGSTFTSTGPQGVDGYLMQWNAMAMLGIAPGVALEGSLPVYNGTIGSNDPAKRIQGTGLGNLEIDCKLRLLKIDFNAIDTLRVAATVGAQLPTGTDLYGADSVNPYLGTAMTWIAGRNGIGLSARWMFNTGSTFDPAFATQTDASMLHTGASWLYRLAPEEYGHEHREAWYFETEMQGIYETDGSAQWSMGPGLLMEGTRFAFEFAVQLPLWENSTNRGNSAFMAMFGLRFLF